MRDLYKEQFSCCGLSAGKPCQGSLSISFEFLQADEEFVRFSML
jgi:hypothetical protein